MALVKYGGGIIQMSGSVAGNTHARNRYGNYIRAKTKPINHNTARQIQVRSTIADLTTRWAQTLSDAQRVAWQLYADSVNMKNRLGEVVKLSGFNHYIRSNAIIASKGPWIVDDGPVVFELPEQDPTFAITASEATQNITLSFDDGMDWANEDPGWLFMFQGSPQNPQRNFFAGPWRYLSRLVGIEGGGVIQPHVAPAVFVMSEGQRIWCYARIMRKDGRLSEAFRADTFCTA